MKALFSTVRNPHFETITEYIERALRASLEEVRFFDDNAFLLPGRFRKGPLVGLDLWALNRRLRSALGRFRPDLFVEAGGERVSAETVEHARRLGIKTVLWTVDSLKSLDEPRLACASSYDHVFCGGTEMLHYLSGRQLRNPPAWLPFACEPESHAPAALSDRDRELFGCEAAFVGSLHPDMYPKRLELLEAAAQSCKLGLWGPGSEKLGSPLGEFVRGGFVKPCDWTKIYSASEIVLCMHYKDPAGRLICNQASPRVYEALACGAFVLCDAQEDVLRLFEDGRHLAVFRDAADLKEKIAYYLPRQPERKAIAEAGRREVLAKHTYAHRVGTILEVLAR